MAAVVAAMRAAQLLPNPTISALLLLLVVLATATAASLRVAVFVSVMAMLALNYFLLPPFHTLTIADPQNWVALFVFLAVAMVASQLSAALRRRSHEALTRQRDLERLYAVSRSVLLAEDEAAIRHSMVRAIADAFEIPGVALYDRQTQEVYRGGADDRPELAAKLEEVARNGKSFQDGTTTITAIRLGGAPTSSLGIFGVTLNDTVLQSVGNLVAIALERARGQAASARAQAAQASSELRAAVLDAAAHEFKTPLTSMKVAATALAQQIDGPDPRRELIDIVNEDVARLESLVTDAVQMLRIDSGDFVVNSARHRVADIINVVMREFAARLEGHQVAIDVPADTTVDADRALLLLAVRQLLDNAVKYSPPASDIGVRAAPGEGGRIAIAVRNTGSTVRERDRERIFERFYRGADAVRVPGTGMGLAIVKQIVQAHGGTLSASSTDGDDTVITMSFPTGAES